MKTAILRGRGMIKGILIRSPEISYVWEQNLFCTSQNSWNIESHKKFLIHKKSTT